MKNCKALVIFLTLCIALLTASASYGQTVVLNAVGSSGVFTTSGLAAVSPDPVTGAAALCGTNFWSGSGGSPSTALAFGIDGRNPGIPHEPGTLWVAWDNDTAPTRICTYLSVDSVVGQRLFFLQNAPNSNATLSLLPAVQYTLGGNKVSFAQDDTSCAASGGNGPFSVDINEASGSTATVTVHGGGNFGNGFANGASVTITGSTISGFNVTGVAVGGVGQLGPVSFTFSTGASSGLGSDTTGGASASVAANCPGIPAAVYTAILAAPHFTVGFTDIRPEDGHFTFLRASGALNSTDPTTPSMGYSSNPASPQGITSSFSKDVAFGLDFALFGGTDPITSNPVPAGIIADIGADPMMMLASNRNTSACGLGNALYNNVRTQDLQLAYSGALGATADISTALTSTASGCPSPLRVIEREPYSGTYNTFEYQVVRAQGWGGGGRFSQENGNVSYPQSNNNLGTSCPAWVASLPTTTASNPSFPPGSDGTLTQTCGNPLNIQTANYSGPSAALGLYNGFGGNRLRAIGTGQMVSVLNSTNVQDAIGYAFYGLGTYGGKTNVKYVALNGVDPLWPSYSGNPYGAGVFPTCTGKLNLTVPTFSCPHGQPTFDGILNGTYSNWNIIRVLYYGSLSTCSAPFTTLSIGCLLQATQDQANPNNGNVRDYVPFVYCTTNSGNCSPVSGIKYFRSHYTASGVTGDDGISTSGCPHTEGGGDAAGTIFPISLEITRLNLIGCSVQLTGNYQ
jgi:hypothetical protein